MIVTEVRLEYTLNARDVFRASMGLAKFRILLGLGISLTLIAGFIIFFLMLDEGKVLLQTSPLFIGIPIIAVGGQLLRMHAASRKYVAALSTSQRQNRLIFSDMTDGFETASGESTGHISWNDIQKIKERQDAFLVFLNKYEVRLIPKTAFDNVSQLQTLRHILTTKLGSRANVLS